MKKLDKSVYENFIKELLPVPWTFKWYKSLGSGDNLGQVVIGGIDNKHEMRIVYEVKHHEDLVRTILHEFAHIFVGFGKNDKNGVIIGTGGGHTKEFWAMYEKLIKINWAFIHLDTSKVA